MKVAIPVSAAARLDYQGARATIASPAVKVHFSEGTRVLGGAGLFLKVQPYYFFPYLQDSSPIWISSAEELLLHLEALKSSESQWNAGQSALFNNCCYWKLTHRLRYPTRSEKKRDPCSQNSLDLHVRSSVKV